MIKAILEDFKMIKSSRKELKEFGITMAAVLAAIALFAFFKKREALLIGSCAAGGFFVFWALAYPPFLGPLQKIWMGLAVLIGFFMSRALLFILYFLAVTPIALVLRCMGKDLLSLKGVRGKETYWQDHENKEISREAYERQY